MTSTTIKLDTNTKRSLDQFREYRNETYDEVLNKLVYIAKNVEKHPELSEEAIQAIDAARTRIRKGNYISESDAMKRLGF